MLSRDGTLLGKATRRGLAIVLLWVVACTPASGGSEGVHAPPRASATPSARQPTPPPTASAEPLPEPDPTAEAPAPSAMECAPVDDEPPGFDDCEAKEVTGAPPCEAICQRKRRAAKHRCCEDPVEVAVLAGTAVLLRLNACGFVPPDCAHVHGHGNMDARLRVLAGAPPELVLVEGGCEARALAHGYVPPGVAAWSGCRHQRYRWDGSRLVIVGEKP